MNVRSLAAAAFAGLAALLPLALPAQSPPAPATTAAPAVAPADVPSPAPSPTPDAAASMLASITIQQCYVTKPRPFSSHASGTQIAYTNIGPTVLHAITFEVVYQNAADTYTRSVQDRGIFAPNTPVSHHFDLYSDVQYAGSTVKSCTARAAS